MHAKLFWLNFHSLIDIWPLWNLVRNQCDMPLAIWYKAQFNDKRLVGNEKTSIYFATTPKRVTDRFFCYYCSRNTNQFRIQTNKLTWKLKCKNYSSVYLHCLIMTSIRCFSVVRVTDLVCVRDLYTIINAIQFLTFFYPGDIQCKGEISQTKWPYEIVPLCQDKIFNYCVIQNIFHFT